MMVLNLVQLKGNKSKNVLCQVRAGADLVQLLIVGDG